LGLLHSGNDVSCISTEKAFKGILNGFLIQVWDIITAPNSLKTRKNTLFRHIQPDC
jgi:hypothetical protein